MKLLGLSCSLVLLLLASLFSQQAAAIVGVDIRGIYTTKELSRKDWGDDLAKQSAYGLGAELDIAVLPFDITALVLMFNSTSKQDESGLSVEETISGQEIHLGIIKGFALADLIRPYIGLGFANSDANYTKKVSSAKVTKKYSDSGYWGSAGLQINFLGIQFAYDYRVSFFPPDKDTKRSLSGSYQSFSLGYRF